MPEWAESHTDHFQRTLIRTTLIVVTCAILLALDILWIVLAIDSAQIKVSLTAAIFITACSAFLAGNTYRLRDIRARKGFVLRSIARDDPARKSAWSELVPRNTIKSRFMLAAAGSALGIIAQLVTLWFASQLLQGGPSVVACLLGVIVCGLCCVGGTFSRPLD